MASDALGIDGALVGAAPHRREVGAHRHARLARGGDDLLEHRERVGDRLVDVHPVVRLAGAEEDGDLAEAGLQRPLQPAGVGDERAVGDARGRLDGPGQLLGVGELGHPLGRDEAGDLDALQARGAQRLDEAALAVEGDQRRLVLEAVAGADLVDRGAIAHRREQIGRRGVGPRVGRDGQGAIGGGGRLHEGGISGGLGALRQHPREMGPRYRLASRLPRAFGGSGAAVVVGHPLGRAGLVVRSPTDATGLLRARRRPARALRDRRRDRGRRDGHRAPRPDARRRRLRPHRRHQAAPPPVRRGPGRLRHAPRRGAARGAHPPPQRGQHPRRGRQPRRALSWSWSTSTASR